jgi:superfamily II DNA or RNA helicase
LSNFAGWTKGDILELMENFTLEEIKDVCRDLSDEIEGIRVSGSKDDLINQLRDSPPNKDELISAIECTVDTDAYLDDNEDDDDDFDDENGDDDEVVYQSSTKDEMLNFLAEESKAKIKEIIGFINENTDYEYSVSKTGDCDDLIANLEEVPKRFLWQAIDAIFEDVENDDDADGHEVDSDSTGADDFDEDDIFSESQRRSISGEERENLEAAFNRPADPEDFRNYQDEATRAVLRFLNHSDRSCATLHIATGGGKTKITNDAIAKLIKENSETRVLWVTKGWRLLYQAATDLNRRHKLKSKMFRLGGGGRELCFMDNFSGNGRVVYTTIHTLRNQMNSLLSEFTPSIIVIDEHHWGHKKPMYDSLLNHKKVKGKVHVLGLSATPRPDNKWPVLYSKTLKELTPEFLAPFKTPDRQPTTDFKWAPKLNQHMVTQASYKELNSPARNRVIADYFGQHCKSMKFGKTLVFAVNIDHCEDLCVAFGKRGIAASFIHSGQSHSENEKNIRKFRKKKYGGTDTIDVLVSVEMMTMGIDIPEIETIFLARPTESEFLFAQMVGRGVRYADGKDHCNLIEFVDEIINQHKNIFKTAKKFFGRDIGEKGDKSPPPTAASGKRRDVKLFSKSSAYDPSAAVQFVHIDFGNGKVLRLPMKSRQSFGLEFELTSDDFRECLDSGRKWSSKAKEIMEVMRQVAKNKNLAHAIANEPEDTCEYKKWGLVKDESCGWEIVSPRLKVESGGIQELNNFLVGLEELGFPESLGLKLNHRTGTHLHLGFCLPKLSEIQALLRTVRYIEPFVALLVAPSRFAEYLGDNEYDLTQSNRFCVSWSHAVDERWISKLSSVSDFKEKVGEMSLPHPDADSRHMTVNFTNLTEPDEIQTLEIRVHSGTLANEKILPWISLWSLLLDTARTVELPRTYTRGDRYLPVPDERTLNRFGEVVGQYLGHPDQDLMDFLGARAREVWKLWIQAKGRRVA